MNDELELVKAAADFQAHVKTGASSYVGGSFRWVIGKYLEKHLQQDIKRFAGKTAEVKVIMMGRDAMVDVIIMDPVAQDDAVAGCRKVFGPHFDVTQFIRINEGWRCSVKFELPA